MKQRTFKDTVHGYIARCGSITTAWALIRNKCAEDKKEIPTLDKIIEIKTPAIIGSCGAGSISHEIARMAASQSKLDIICFSNEDEDNNYLKDFNVNLTRRYDETKR